MIRTVFIVMAILQICLISSLLADENLWSTSGPAGATVMTIEPNYHQNNSVYIGTVSSGLYRTFDNGESWDNIRHCSEEYMYLNIRDIAIHPITPDTVFAATTRGLYKSADNCSTWSYANLPLEGEQNFVKYHPLQPELIFAGGWMMSWKSYDGGNTWVELDVTGLTGMMGLEIHPLNPDLIFLIGGSFSPGHGVWRSNDRGITWENIQHNISLQGYPSDIELDPYDTNIVYVSVSNYSDSSCPNLYKSYDCGETWTDISVDFLISSDVEALEISPLDNDVLYAGTLENGVLLSEDAGESWREINDGMRTLHLESLEIDTSTLDIYAGTVYDGIYKKHLAEAEWRDVSNDIYSGYFRRIDVSRFSPAKALAIGDNGVFQTEDYGTTWSYIDIEMPSESMLKDAEYDRYLPNRIYASSSTAALLQPTDMQRGFYRSDDGGNSWDYFTDGLPNEEYFFEITVSYENENDRRIFLTTYKEIYSSDDEGEHWELRDSGLPFVTTYSIGDIEVAPSDPNTIGVVYYSQNKLYLSKDRGETWFESGELPEGGEGLGIDEIEFHPDDPDHIYASIYFNGIYESLDGGDTWQSIINDLPLDGSLNDVSSITINPYNPDNIFVSSFRYGVYQSHNGGLNWESFNEGMDTTGIFNEMMFAPGDTTILYLARGNRSVWSITRTPVGIDDNEVTLPTQYNLSAYPNPFNASTSISFTLPHDSQVALEIYDVLGRKLESLVDEYLPAGVHSVLWEAGEYPSGMYFYKLTAGEQSESLKITLIK